MFDNGKYAKDNKPYVFLRDMARKYGLVSGQDWGHATESATFVDSGHVQRVPVWRQDALSSRSARGIRRKCTIPTRTARLRSTKDMVASLGAPSNTSQASNGPRTLRAD